jgi:hypothetical protein
MIWPLGERRARPRISAMDEPFIEGRNPGAAAAPQGGFVTRPILHHDP